MVFGKLFYFEIHCFLTWQKTTALKLCFRHYKQNSIFQMCTVFRTRILTFLISANLLVEKILLEISESSISWFSFFCFFKLLPLKDNVLCTIFYVGTSEMFKNYVKSVQVVSRLTSFKFSVTSLNVSFIFLSFLTVEHNFWSQQQANINC